MHYAYKRAFENVKLLGYVFGRFFNVSYLSVLHVKKCYIPHFTNLALPISIFLFGFDVFHMNCWLAFRIENYIYIF